MINMPLHPMRGKNNLHAQMPGWNIRPLRKSDLPRVADWVSTLSNDRASYGNIAAWMTVDWLANKAAGYARYFLVTLYDQPFLHITAVGPNKRAGEDPAHATALKLYVLLNPSFDENQDIWMHALNTCFRFFYNEEGYARLLISIVVIDHAFTSALRQLGFSPCRPKGWYSGTSQTFCPL